MLLPEFGIPLCKTQLGMRTAYRQSAVFGQTVHDFKRPAAAAIEEVENLTSEILSLLPERKTNA